MQRVKIFFRDKVQLSLEDINAMLDELVPLDELKTHQFSMTPAEKKAIRFRAYGQPIMRMAGNAIGHNVEHIVNTPEEASDAKADFALHAFKKYFDAQKNAADLPYLDQNDYVLMYISDEKAKKIRKKDTYYILAEYSPALFANVTTNNGRPTSLAIIDERMKDIYEGLTPDLKIPSIDPLITDAITDTLEEISQGTKDYLDLTISHTAATQKATRQLLIDSKKAGMKIQAAKYSDEDLRQHYVSFDNSGVTSEILTTVAGYFSAAAIKTFENKSTYDHRNMIALSKDKSSNFYQMLRKFYPTKTENAHIRTVLLTDDIRPTTRIRPHEADTGNFTLYFENDIDGIMKWVEDITLPAGICYSYVDDDRFRKFGGSKSISLRYDETLIASDNNKMVINVSEILEDLLVNSTILSNVIQANRDGIYFSERNKIDTTDFAPSFGGRNHTFLRLESGSQVMYTNDHEGETYYVTAHVDINQQDIPKEERLDTKYTYHFSTPEEAAEMEKYLRQCIGCVLPEYVNTVSRTINSRAMMIYEKNYILDESIDIDDELFRFLLPDSNIYFVNEKFRMSTSYKMMLDTEAEQMAREMFKKYGMDTSKIFLEMIAKQGVVSRMNRSLYSSMFRSIISDLKYDHDYLSYYMVTSIASNLEKILKFHAQNLGTTDAFAKGSSENQTNVSRDIDEHKMIDTKKDK